MNPKHSSKNDSWMTPVDVVERARKVLGTIDLDPASSPKANERIDAKRIITREEDALGVDWECEGQTIFLNPPGGKSGNRSMVDLFWQRLLSYRHQFDSAIFVCFSIEALQVIQISRERVGHVMDLEQYPICIPSKRIKFDREDGQPAASPTHANAIVYVPGKVDCSHIFIDEFEDLGIILNRGEF